MQATSLLSVIGVSAALLLTADGCGSQTPPSLPTSTTNSTAPTAAAPPTYPVGLQGQVLDERGIPVAGAQVYVDQSSIAPVLTDAGGRYNISGQVPWQSGFQIVISKSGFEDTDQYVPSPFSNATRTFRLFVPITLAAGGAARITLGPDNTFCDIDDAYNCRRIHIVASAVGTLTVDVSADPGGPQFWVIVANQWVYPFKGGTHLEQAMQPGSVLAVDVVRSSGAPASDWFTLQTSFR